MISDKQRELLASLIYLVIKSSKELNIPLTEVEKTFSSEKIKAVNKIIELDSK